MRMVIFLLGLVFPILSWSATALDVCNEIGKKVPAKGNECNTVISQAKHIDNTAVEPCHVAAFQDPEAAFQCIKSMVENVFDPKIVRSCVIVARRFTPDVPTCMSTIANKVYTQADAIFCEKEAYKDTKLGLQCLLQNGQPQDKKVCPTYDEIRMQVKTGLDLINQKANEQAAFELNDLLAKLAVCN